MKKYIRKSDSIFFPETEFEVDEIYYDEDFDDRSPIRALKKFSEEDSARRYADRYKKRTGKDCCVYLVEDDDKEEIYNTFSFKDDEEIESCERRVFAASKSDVKEIHDRLLDKASEVLQSEDYGYDLKDIADILTIDEEETDDGRLRVEVRCELSYEGMRGLCEELDKIISKVDKEAYFDDVAPGISEAYVDMDEVFSATNSCNIGSKVESATYLFPKFTPEDRSVARRDYGLEIVSEGPSGTLAKGSHGDIKAFADEYLGYELNPEHFYLDEEDEGEEVLGASYGGAYDIADDQYFTKDDIIEFGDHVIEILEEMLPGKYQLQDIDMKSPTELHIEVTSDDETSYAEDTFKVDMRKIKLPRDLKERYADEVAQRLKEQLHSEVV